MPYKDKKKQIEWISEKRRRYKRKLVKMAGGKCQLCGYSRCESLRISPCGWKERCEHIPSI